MTKLWENNQSILGVQLPTPCVGGGYVPPCDSYDDDILKRLLELKKMVESMRDAISEISEKLDSIYREMCRI